MQIKISKESIFVVIAVIIMCGASFCAGRYIRVRRASGDSEQLIEGIVLSGDTANRVLDELGIARSSGESAADLGRAVARGIEKLQRSNETARVCIDKLNREVATTQQNIKVIQSSFDDVSDSIQLGFRLAEEQAGAYERVVDTLQQFNSDSSKDE